MQRANVSNNLSLLVGELELILVPREMIQRVQALPLDPIASVSETQPMRMAANKGIDVSKQLETIVEIQNGYLTPCEGL